MVTDAWANTSKPRYKMTRAANVPWRDRGSDYQSPWGEQYPTIRDQAGNADRHGSLFSRNSFDDVLILAIV